MAKPEHECFRVTDVPFRPCAGDVPSLREAILAADPVGGVASRLLRFEPGTDSSSNGVQVHDFWEEVYVLAGSLTDLRLDQTFTAGMCACRPPGMEHGLAQRRRLPQLRGPLPRLTRVHAGQVQPPSDILHLRLPPGYVHHEVEGGLVGDVRCRTVEVEEDRRREPGQPLVAVD